MKKQAEPLIIKVVGPFPSPMPRPLLSLTFILELAGVAETVTGHLVSLHIVAQLDKPLRPRAKAKTEAKHLNIIGCGARPA